MFIKEIILKNFRVYLGDHSLVFEKDSDKNIYIISGNNGYGKTSLLTSLIWCLYGKNMQEVDESFKRQILDMGGYRKYIHSCLNYVAASKGVNDLSVNIHFSDIHIPGFTCNEISISRSYDSITEHEELEILMDGKSNELIQEVGKEIFIHDFILPKEIAKFFFFDAEKNVALAEIKSLNDRLNISKAYSEILGIKKYEDLKSHLVDLRMRFRKSSASSTDFEKLTKQELEIEKIRRLILDKQEKIEELTTEKTELKAKSEKLQEKLIREGSVLSLEQVKKLQVHRSKLQKEHEVLKHKFIELIDLVPFAIAGNWVHSIEAQLNKEASNASKELSTEIVNKKVKDLLQDFQTIKIIGLKIDKKTRAIMSQTVAELLEKHFIKLSKVTSSKSMLNFSREEESHFDGIVVQLRTSFRLSLMDINRALRNNRIEFNKINKQLNEAESKEVDKLIQSYRQDKTSIDNKINSIEGSIIDEHKELSITEHQYANKRKVMEELAKKVSIENKYLQKDQLTAKLIEELDTFLSKIKHEKRQALEGRIQNSLNSLMHKEGFITKVKVQIENDILDIHLYNKRTEIIKDNLSKGEQQIYATALLKAFVEESNINFPIFVDSPMQKYDKDHAEKIITNFYPVISKQVVLFPLLNKEMSKEEFGLLFPFVKSCYLIQNASDTGSYFIKTEPAQLFNQSNKPTYAQ